MVGKLYTTRSGAVIFVGRNAHENDIMTTSHPFSDDLWFHIKNEPGAHVILSGSKEMEDIQYAALLAVQHSKAKHGKGRVPVSYCPIHDIEKPKRSKSGEVMMLTEKVIHVNLN